MTRYVAFLKGVNVGRRKRIAMSDLRELLIGLGYVDVTTYLASGNALFTTYSKKPAASLVAEMEERIAAEFGMVVRVIVRTGNELTSVIARNPLAGEPENPSRFFVGFLSATPSSSLALSVEREVRASAPAGDAIWLSGAEAFLWCPGGFSLLDHAARIEKRLGMALTTRTWNTVKKVTQIAVG